MKVEGAIMKTVQRFIHTERICNDCEAMYVFMKNPKADFATFKEHPDISRLARSKLNKRTFFRFFFREGEEDSVGAWGRTVETKGNATSMHIRGLSPFTTYIFK